MASCLPVALVKRLVELHGGRITAHSEGTGKGATFIVRLPVAPVRLAVDVPDSSIPTRSEIRLDGMRVLIVDDETDARELLAKILQFAGAEVLEAPDGPSALALLAGEQVSVVVSDVGMPGMDGLSLMREARRQGIYVPAVALTAYTRAVDRTLALQSGFQAHVPKPVDRLELLTVVASMAGRL